MPQEFRCSFFLVFLIQPLATKDVKDHYPKKMSSTKRNEFSKRRREESYPKIGPPRSRNRSKSGRVREGQNSRIWRPSKSGHFSIEVLLKSWVRASPGPIWRVFGKSKTGRPEGRPERPTRRPTTPSKSTRSSRLCSASSRVQQTQGTADAVQQTLPSRADAPE